MKKIPLVLALAALAAASLRAADAPADPWVLFAQQADQMAVAVKAQDPRTLHQLDHAVGQEAADLQTNGPALPNDAKKKLNGLLADMAVQATAAHHDAHQAKWDEAAAAQAKFSDDVKATRALLPSKS
jgi:hypothetical protein